MKYEYDVEELLGMKPDPNWGFIESEIEVVGRLSEEDRLEVGITKGLVRVSVGLEHVDDIIRDLKQALVSD